MVYYRFEQQYTAGGGLNYRIPQGSLVLNDDVTPNYTTAWINANQSFNNISDISSGNYNFVTLTFL